MKFSDQIFSFHLMKLPLLRAPAFFFGSRNEIPGLKHAESLLTMNLGAPVAMLSRYNFRTAAFFAWWEEEKFLDAFLESPSGRSFSTGWHVRMKLYRRWGQVTELKDAELSPDLANKNKCVIAVTLARLNLLQTARFINWGKPVEKQVRDHQGQNLALAAIRPPNTFSTFSIWKNESEMINMVHGLNQEDGQSHKLAIQERDRKDFHHEFTTMRFIPLKESGAWNGRADYLGEL